MQEKLENIQFISHTSGAFSTDKCMIRDGVLVREKKGHIISKGLFGVLEFSQKTNERIRSSSKFVCSFFGRIRGYQKSIRNYLTFDASPTKYRFLSKSLI